MEAFILFIVLIMGLYFHSKISGPKELERWAEKTCSYMKYAEVIVQVAHIRANFKNYGFMSDKDRILLRFLEERERLLQSSATPESIEQEVKAFAFMANPEKASRCLGEANTKVVEETMPAGVKPRYRMIDGKWQQVRED